MRLQTSLVTALVMTAAGTSAALAQDLGREDRQVPLGDLQLILFDELQEVEVQNARDETLGEIENLVIDRGSGRIAFAIIGGGGLMEIGDSHTAIRFDKLDWQPLDDEFILTIEEDVFEALPEFDPENWASLNNEDIDEWWEWEDEQADVDYEIEGDEDPFEDLIDMDAENETLTGVVLSSHRFLTDDGQYVKIVLEPLEGTDNQEIILGPSWFVTSSLQAPLQQDRVSVDAIRIDYDGEPAMLAYDVTMNDKTLRLRDSAGSAAWLNPSAAQTRNIASRYVLLEEMLDRECSSITEDCGEVEDVVIDLTSGKILLVVLDPDDNFLGIGDEERLVPYSVVSVTGIGDSVRINASNRMIKDAPIMPDNLSELANVERIREIYQRFEGSGIVLAPAYDIDY